MKLTVERQILIAFLLAIVSLGAISLITYRSTEKLIHSLRSENERLEALYELSEILALAGQAETVPRGYLLTGDEQFALQLMATEDLLTPRLGRIETLLTPAGGQTERLAQMRSLIWENFDHARRLIAARRSAAISTELPEAEVERGRALSTRIAGLAEEMKQAELDARRRADATGDASAQWLRRFMLFGQTAAILIVALAGIGVINEFRRRQRAEDALHNANTELARQVEEQSEEMLRKTGEWQFEIQNRLQAEQAARREAEMANRLKDEFLANVSHELRAPLNAILGWARLLRARRLDEPTATRAIQTIERSAESQNRLIEDLLDVSRITTGKLKIEARQVSPIVVVKAALETVAPSAAAKQISLATEIPAEIPMLAGDATRLQQVISNLLSNAVKFTPKGGQVSVSLTNTGSQIEFAVRDNGQGIKPEFLPYVFERFRQADSSSARRHGGLGLGLAIVRHLVEMHGGTVEARSEGEGRGATFFVRIPIPAGSAEESFNRRPDFRRHTLSRFTVPRVPEQLLAGLRILAVDDQEEVRDLISEILSGYGASVITVGSAAEALETLVREQPNLLVSDLGMPVEDGYSLIKRVRALDATIGGATPAIALTSYAQMSDRLRALNAGFQTHLVKPVEPTELVMTIAALTGRDIRANGTRGN